MTIQKIKLVQQAQEIIKDWKKRGETIVFTNGCFDILHLGHVDYLEKAKELGTKLIVAINSDNSINRLKGKSRPIISQESRVRLVAALSCVDLVLVFEEDTPLNVISIVLPSILVKGDDYTLETIVGAKEVLESGGTIQTIPLVKGYSTTSIIAKIQELTSKSV